MREKDKNVNVWGKKEGKKEKEKNKQNEKEKKEIKEGSDEERKFCGRWFLFELRGGLSARKRKHVNHNNRKEKDEVSNIFAPHAYRRKSNI